ncbi:MAG: hypothetical protein VYE81_05365 [Planctomycetota bacterium]|nr:hypothetical protein [Planctomycetota bacterium]
MNTTTRNVLAVLAGVVAGSVLNMGLINVGQSIIPPPEGADISTMEGLSESMELFTPKNFVFPYLAHALGTLFGAFVAAKLAASRHMALALGVGVFFLIGGIMAASMLGGPLWFNVLDLASAYVPMGFIGGTLARGKASRPA